MRNHWKRPKPHRFTEIIRNGGEKTRFRLLPFRCEYTLIGFVIIGNLQYHIGLQKLSGMMARNNLHGRADGMPETSYTKTGPLCGHSANTSLYFGLLRHMLKLIK